MELSTQNLPDYLREHQQEIRIFTADTKIAVEEIGDGNLNFVFRAFDANEPSKSVVLKQAPPYIKILGPSYELTPERLTYESRALAVYNQFVPEFAPHQIYFDRPNYIIVMEDLSGYHILRDELINGVVDARTPENIAHFMAITHSRTHVQNLSSAQAESYAARFGNSVMQGITAEYIFTKPFTDDPTNFYTDGLEPHANALKRDQPLLAQIQHLKEIFLTSQQGLTHGDLHTGSVMVQGDATKVIDFEFAFYGPVGFDIGLYWASYLLSYCSHAGNESVRSQLKAGIQRTWEIYATEFEMADKRHKADVLTGIFHESVGFTGMEMMRRLIGAAHVQDIEGIPDTEHKLSVERAVLTLGSTLVKRHGEVETIAEVLELIA
ncbi:MAG: S-methyl-5-thioribose kinase [Candidatus Poribacteria bacterium]|nr:S-methyl-5-thioribose kinase [Candidatus Poribacteria bacterium]